MLIPFLDIADKVVSDYLRWRKYNKALNSFLSKEDVMIRWDVPRELQEKGDNSYEGIVVKREVVQKIVEEHYKTLMDDCGLNNLRLEC